MTGISWRRASHVASGALLIALTAALPVAGALPASATPDAPSNVQIAELYAGGGTYQQDYIELFNPTGAAVDLSGDSVQYTGDDSGVWQVTPLTGSIPADGYYLIAEAGADSSLPAPDDTGTIDLAPSEGAVALVSGITPITVTTQTGTAGLIDLVGWQDIADQGSSGVTIPAEADAPAPAMAGGDALARTHGGCSDSDDNYLDVFPATPDPKNSSSATRTCSALDTRPAVDEQFPYCASPSQQYCIASFTVDNTDVTTDPNWELTATLGGYGTEVLYRDSPSDPFEPLPADQSPEPQVAYSIRIGDIRWRDVRGHADGLSVTWSGDASSGYTLDVSGQFTEIHFDQQDVANSTCAGQGDCGNSTTEAGYEASVFEVDTPPFSNNFTENNNVFDPGSNDYQDTWIVSGAEYRDPFPTLDPDTHSWSIKVGNVHLTSAGQPVTEGVSVHIGAPLLTALGVTQDQAVSAGIGVTRTDGSTTTTVPAAIAPAADGGVDMRIPALTFSTPTLRFRKGGHNTVIAPDPPIDVAAIPHNGFATVRFAAPGFDGGSPITGYDIACNQGTQRLTGESTSAVAVDVTGMTNGDPYFCKVRADNTKQTGPWSAPVSVVPSAGAAPSAPGGVESFAVTTTAAGTIKTSWQPPASTGGAAVSGYRVTACKQGRACPSDPLLRKLLPATATSYTIPKGALATGPYVVAVQARNSVGYGDPVSAGARTTLAAPRVTAPAISTATSTNADVVIRWGAPRGSSYPKSTLFTATYTVDGGKAVKTLVRHSGLNNIVLKGKPGTTYRVSVVAIDTSNTAGPATTVTVVIPKDQPGAARHWTRVRSARLFLGSALQSSTRGATLSSAGRGSRVYLIGSTSRAGGAFEVKIDHGGWSRPIRTSGPSRLRQLLWTSPRLKSTGHTVQIRVAGKGRPVTIDAIAYLM